MTLAEASAQIGVDISRLSRWENGKSFPGALSMERLRKWAEGKARAYELPHEQRLDLAQLVRAMERKAKRGKR